MTEPFWKTNAARGDDRRTSGNCSATAAANAACPSSRTRIPARSTGRRVGCRLFDAGDLPLLRLCQPAGAGVRLRPADAAERAHHLLAAVDLRLPAGGRGRATSAWWHPLVSGSRETRAQGRHFDARARSPPARPTSPSRKTISTTWSTRSREAVAVLRQSPHERADECAVPVAVQPGCAHVSRHRFGEPIKQPQRRHDHVHAPSRPPPFRP